MHRSDAEKSDASAGCGEILACPAADISSMATGVRAMNILRIPKSPPLRRTRKGHDSTRRVQLELTLEMPSHRPIADPPVVDEDRKSERGIAEIDFYI